MYENSFLIDKTFTYSNFFWLGFFEIKSKQIYLSFRFDICFKINLVPPLGFVAINVKNCIRKILNVNLIYFNSFISLIAEFPTSNFMFVISYFCKKKFNHMALFFLFPNFFVKILQFHAKVQEEKKVCINHLNLMNEQKHPLKNMLCKHRYSSK